MRHCCSDFQTVCQTSGARRPESFVRRPIGVTTLSGTWKGRSAAQRGGRSGGGDGGRWSFGDNECVICTKIDVDPRTINARGFFFFFPRTHSALSAKRPPESHGNGNNIYASQTRGKPCKHPETSPRSSRRRPAVVAMENRKRARYFCSDISKIRTSKIIIIIISFRFRRRARPVRNFRFSHVFRVRIEYGNFVFQPPSLFISERRSDIFLTISTRLKCIFVSGQTLIAYLVKSNVT